MSKPKTKRRRTNMLLCQQQQDKNKQDRLQEFFEEDSKPILGIGSLGVGNWQRRKELLERYFVGAAQKLLRELVGIVDRYCGQEFNGTSCELSGHSESVRSVCAFGNGGLYLASGSDDKTVCVWDLQKGTQRTITGHKGAVSFVCAMSDEGFVSGSYDGTIIEWDLRNKKQKQIILGYSSPVTSISTLKNNLLIVGCLDGTLRIWNTDKEVEVWRTTCFRDVYSVCSLDNNLFASCCYNYVHIWDAKKGLKPIMILFGHTKTVQTVCKIGKGLLASGSYDNTVRIWNLEIKDKCVQTLTGHTGPVVSLCNLGDGRLASGSFDQTIRIWDLDKGGECVQVLTGHTQVVSSICALGDGRIASGSWDNTIRIWF